MEVTEVACAEIFKSMQMDRLPLFLGKLIGGMETNLFVVFLVRLVFVKPFLSRALYEMFLQGTLMRGRFSTDLWCTLRPS